jgi:glycerol uptake facilitator protein
VVGAVVGAASIIGVLGKQASDVGLGVAAYNPDTVNVAQAFTAEFVGTFILVFTIFGVIHRKAAAGFAGVAIGLVVFAAIIPVAPTTGASINPARTFGPMLVQQIAGGDVKWEQLPVYLAAEVIAGVAAALLFGFLSRTPADRQAAAGVDLGAPDAGAASVRESAHA